MYWTDAQSDRIERATMDGNSRSVLHSTGLSNAYGLTLDYQQQILYWTDYTINRIESSFVNGSNRQVIVSNLNRDPWALTFHNGMLYWSDTAFDRIYSFSVTSSPASVIQVTGGLGGDTYDLRVVSPDRQPLSMFSVLQVCTHLHAVVVFMWSNTNACMNGSRSSKIKD